MTDVNVVRTVPTAAAPATDGRVKPGHDGNQTDAVAGERSTWRDVGALADIPPLRARTVTTAHGDVAIFRTADDRVFALHDECPHKRGKLSQGIVHDERVTCPLHGWVIRLADGQAQSPDEGCTRVVQVRLDAGRILLRLATA